jgi:hypothetical protein
VQSDEDAKIVNSAKELAISGGCSRIEGRVPGAPGSACASRQECSQTKGEPNNTVKKFTPLVT